MALREYVGDAMFRFSLQTGNWPDCDLTGSGSLDELRVSLQVALTRGGYEFLYEDISGEATANVMLVAAPVPCGDMAPVADVPGVVMWGSSRSPKPGEVWTFGAGLADWLEAVPWVTPDFTVMIGLTWLSVRETGGGPGGVLYPEPGTQE